MNKINEQLNPAHGWSSGRRIPQGAPARGLGRSNMNADVLAWVPGTNVAIRMEAGQSPWFYVVMTWPGIESQWMRCKYNGNNLPEVNRIEDLIKWAKTKKFNGLNITD